MYLILDRDDKTKFKIVPDYRAYQFGAKDRFDVYCGKRGQNKGKRVAKKMGSKSTIDVLIVES